MVPEIASRMHIEAISNVVKKALEDANVTMNDITAIAVTSGPGLVGALHVGLSFAKGLSFKYNKPLVATHHLKGHIAANYITYEELKQPFLALIVSGGHTHLVYVKDYNDLEILGRTRDDAIGEAYDKVARIAGLGYPGGPKVDKLAKEGKPSYYDMIPKVKMDGYDFSFSGIKTSIINLNHNSKEKLNYADLANSFEKVTTEILVKKVLKALEEYNLDKVAVCGGVSANSYIRAEFEKLKEDGIQVYFPPIKLCTDNAAMIASAGYYNYIDGIISDYSVDAKPNLILK